MAERFLSAIEGVNLNNREGFLLVVENVYRQRPQRVHSSWLRGFLPVIKGIHGIKKDPRYTYVSTYFGDLLPPNLPKRGVFGCHPAIKN
jgi:hypothetical protein